MFSGSVEQSSFCSRSTAVVGLLYSLQWIGLQCKLPQWIASTYPSVLGCHPHYTPIEENRKKRSFDEFYYDLVIETIGPVRKSGNPPPSVAHILRHLPL